MNFETKVAIADWRMHARIEQGPPLTLKEHASFFAHDAIEIIKFLPLALAQSCGIALMLWGFAQMLKA